MICPCCGGEREVAAMECRACGARQVGTPLLPPDVVLPKMGPALMALGCAILVVTVFLAAWIFGNDMKVGRVFLVTLLGEGTKLTRNLLQADPKLPYYRVFSYDAYRLAFLLSLALIPLSLMGIWLARRARRLATQWPERFGGGKLARVSLALSTVWLVVFSTVTVTSVPEAIERGRAKRRAATRAVMYQLHQQALQKYYQEYGSYPQELSDLARINAEASPRLDYWERSFSYLPVGVIASKGSAISFSNYKLVSAGADGKFGSPDDLTMIDGVIIEGPVEEDLPSGGLLPEK